MLNSQWPNILQESIVFPRPSQPRPGSGPLHTWLWPGRPPRLYQDPGPPQPDLLVAWHLTIHSHLCQGLCPLFPHKDPCSAPPGFLKPLEFQPAHGLTSQWTMLWTCPGAPMAERPTDISLL